MAEDRLRQRPDVLDRYVIPAVHQGARFRAADDRLRTAESRAPSHPFVDEVRHAGLAGTRRADEAHRVARDFFGDDDLPHEILKVQDVGPRQHALRHLRLGARRLRHDRDLVVLVQISNHDVEHEAIELRFGQRICALELDGILRGEDEERPFERIGPPRRRDVVLLHRLEEGGLRFRRRAVDLVGEDDLGENRSLHEPQTSRALLLVEDFGSRNVRRHQVGRELDPLVVEIEDVRERLDQQRLREAGDAGDQTVSAGEERDEDLLDDFILPDDDLAQFAENPLAAFRDPLSADDGA